MLREQFEVLKRFSIVHTGFLQNILSSVLSVIATDVSPEVIKQNELKLIDKQLSEKKINIIYNTDSLVLTVISTGILVVIGVLCIKNVENGKMTIGVMLSLVIYFQKAFGEVLKLATTCMNVQEGFVSVERIKNRLYPCETSLKQKNVKRSKDAPVKIGIANLTFLYENKSDYVIDNLNVVFNKGEISVVVGDNGCGKTTLLRLIYKFINKYEGSIFGGDKNIRIIDSSFLRNNISYIPQEGHIFQGSVKDNLTLWNSYSEEDINKILSIVGLDDTLKNKKEGVDEEVDLDGQNFSGGELQKIIIARELLRDRPVILMDEATRSIDSASTERIMRHLNKIKKEKIIIIVTHDQKIVGDQLISLSSHN